METQILTIDGSDERRMCYDLDSLDRAIIRGLQQDGRASNVDVARCVGVSEATVRKRLERLQSEGVIRVTAVPDAGRVGFASIAFVMLSVELAQVGRISEQIASLPEVRAIYLTTGGSELLVEAWFRSSDDLVRFMTQQIGCIPGIRRTAMFHILRTIKDGSGWVLPAVAADDE